MRLGTVETFDDYDAGTVGTWRGSPINDELLYLAVCVNGEAGEFAEKVKKAYRDDNGVLTEHRREAILYELGDVLYYLTRTAIMLDSSLREVAQMNYNKLADRKARGVLGGEGDER
jgi:NTP pyrophosphatase (non-canonical NTP hydrolase)